MQNWLIMNNRMIVCGSLLFLAGCSASHTKTHNKGEAVPVEEVQQPFLIDSLVPGIPAYGAATVRYKREDRPVMTVKLGEPVVVAVADKPEKWGYFQFPHIDRMPEGAIRIRWNLNVDAMEAYGSNKFGEVVSGDGARSWHPLQDTTPGTDLLLPNGDWLSIRTPKPIKASEVVLPQPIGGTGHRYRLSELPESCRGIYFDRFIKNGHSWRIEKADLKDPHAVRSVARGLLPIIWWGDMHIAADGSLIAGVYPGSYVGDDGKIAPHGGVFFYRSTDGGRSWNVQGRIFYSPDLAKDPKGNKRGGFTEPAFEILADGSFLCVMRTTDGNGNGPAYASRSTDLGRTWTKPQALNPSGVLPRLLQLENGVLVLSSGRPGVQLRFSNDGKGAVWTNAFEMMPYKNYKDQVSCGYTGLLATGPDRFLIVYSDFRYPNEAKEMRKAIKVREVVVTPE